MASKPKPADTPATPAEPVALADYRPVAGQRSRHDGWTAERQRTFLTALAETGSVRDACDAAGVCPRSAYRLRQRADAAAFARAWEQALQLAAVRLISIAFERATNGTVKEFWRDGQLVGQTRAPSDRLLMFLLDRMLPAAGSFTSRLAVSDRAVDQARAWFPATLARLTDHDDMPGAIDTGIVSERLDDAPC